MLLGSVRSNLSLGFDSGSKNQTRFSSKLVPFFLCFPKKSKSIRVLLGSVRCNLSFGLNQVLKIRPGSGRNKFHFFMFPEEE